jgi:hypothetical protein
VVEKSDQAAYVLPPAASATTAAPARPAFTSLLFMVLLPPQGKQAASMRRWIAAEAPVYYCPAEQEEECR